MDNVLLSFAVILLGIVTIGLQIRVWKLSSKLDRLDKIVAKHLSLDVRYETMNGQGVART